MFENRWTIWLHDNEQWLENSMRIVHNSVGNWLNLFRFVHDVPWTRLFANKAERQTETDYIQLVKTHSK